MTVRIVDWCCVWHFHSAEKILEATIAATLLPFELVVFGVSCPCGAKADQLGCDVGETPLQSSGALPPKITVENRFTLTFPPYMVKAGSGFPTLCVTCVCCRGLVALDFPPPEV